MAEATLSPRRKQTFSALDPRLSFLASQAAVELDNLLLDKGTELEAVRKLGIRLEESMESSAETGERRTFLDAPTVSVLTEAITQSSPQAVQSLADLVKEAWQMATDLRGTEPTSDKSALRRLRSFCLFLSQNARSYRQSIFDMQPELPFRS
ncbi:MAG: hypothetical protein ACLQNE_02480 [Thermoguttaceae bacterium]